MQSKTSLIWLSSIVSIAGVVCIAGIAFFSIIIFFLNLNLPFLGSYTYIVEPIQNIAIAAEQANLGLPVRLKIPKINVDSAVEYVGIASNGAMDVPKKQDEVGWFNLGPRPGENGSAVIDGHFGWYKDGVPAVFDNLNKLRKGDKLTVEDEKGAVISFVVRKIKSYDPNANTSEVFGSNDGKPHLNLITCGGVWDKSQKSYSNRLVVFADKE